jgi:hypothetical protein
VGVVFTVPELGHNPGVSPMVRTASIADSRIVRLEPLEPRLLLADSIVISEFMADNGDVLEDQFGKHPDWIELHNTGTDAVNLGGWHLTNRADDLDKWDFPSITLDAGAYMVVFASEKDLTDVSAPLHTNFKLTAGGDYLALTKPDGTTIVSEYRPSFPVQYTDVSYGLSETTTATTILASGAAAKTFIPANGTLGLTWTAISFNDGTGSGWVAGQTGMGYQTLVPGFTVKNYKAAAGVYMNDLSYAETLLATPSQQSAVYTEIAPYVDYVNTGGGAHFSNNRMFPGFTFGPDMDHYAVEATALITVPQAGLWTFGVNSDDGFSVKITGATVSSSTNTEVPPTGGDTFGHYTSRGPEDSFAIYNFSTAGDYTVRLLFFEGNGGSELEFFAAQGSYTSYSTNFRLVGDTANSGLKAQTSPGSGTASSAYSTLIKSNLLSRMYGVNASAYMRVPFNVTNPAAYDSLFLRMKYDDGFVAYLNGVEVARRNAPASPTWNSAATAEHGTQAAVVFEDINITDHLGLLQTGSNVLAIQGLNKAASDLDFLIVPELADINVTATSERYFAAPSPGWANASQYVAFVTDTKFDMDRGFYTTAFNVNITCDTPGATIRYTTDSSTPTETYGTIYNPASPVPISGTTTLRTIAYKTGYEPSNVDTQTYLFLSDVITQSPLGQTPGTGWPTGTVNGQIINYGMDPDVVNNSAYASSLIAALTQVPTISLVTDLSNLFNPSTGIYVNAGQDGEAWERPASIELINPDGSDGFQINAGLRIRGGYSRDGNNPKHAFRILFDEKYGEAELKFPLFGDEGVNTFKNIDLRTSQNYSWSYGGDSRNIMVRDYFSRQLQMAMGEPYTRSQFVHVYIDGQYWGLYMTEERPEADFAQSYLGGNDDDYDVIKVTDGYVMFPTDGTMDAFTQLYNAAVTGFSNTTDYYRVMGLNSNGTPNPAYTKLLDPVNVADYMISIYYSGDLDASISNFRGNSEPNNTYCIFNRANPDGFKFFRHDAEHTLLDVNVDRTGPWPNPGLPYGGTMALDKFNPQWLHQQLTANAEYRQLFADRVYKHMVGAGGVMTPSAASARFQGLTSLINMAIIAESARWGDSKTSTPRTKNNDWQPTVNSIVNNWFPQRTGIVLNQFIAKGWYPSLAGPTFSLPGGLIPSIPPYWVLTITAPAGSIKYTLNGIDPRLPGGALAPGALTYTGSIQLDRSMHVMARVLSGGVWSALADATYVRDTTPPLRITEIMYNPAPPVGGSYTADDFEFIELQNISASTLNVTGYAFSNGITFAFPTMSALTIGQRVVVAKNPTAFATRYSTAGMILLGPYTGVLNNAGERITLLGSVGETVQSFQYSDGWYPQTDGEGFSLVIRDTAQALPLWNDKEGWRVSTSKNGGPGLADIGYNPGAVIVNEVLAHTKMDSAPDYGDWIELKNTTAAPINLGGWFLSDDPLQLNKYRIADGTILPASGATGYIVFTQFQHFGVGANAFSLSELGEAVYLTAPAADGTPGGYRESQSFDASDREFSMGLYTKSTGGTDFVQLASKTPGAANSLPLVGGFHINQTEGYAGDIINPGVVINEVMYNPATTDGDEFIELWNLSASVVKLYDPMHPENRWKFTEGIAPSGVPFVLPAWAEIPAYGYALVVPIDPETYRTKYGISASVPIFGPYAPGVLSNEGDSIELQKPGTPHADGTVPYYRVDRLTYNNKLPWPVWADGSGSSLIRLVSTGYGNDVANWGAGTADGTPGATNRGLDTTPPTTPGSVMATVISASQIDISWAAATDPESGIGGYRIYRNSILIADCAMTIYHDTTVQPAVAYTYQVAAVNRDGVEGAKCTGVIPDVRVVTIEATQPNAAEQNRTKGTWTITRNGSLLAAMTIFYTVDASSTASLSDYDALPTSVTLGINQATATIDLNPADDAISEPAETVVLRILSGAGYQIGSPSSATVYIADNDAPVVSIQATTSVASENGLDGVYTFTRFGSLAAPLVANYAVDTVNSTASPSDYQSFTGSVSFLANQATAIVDLWPIDDLEDEPTETVVLQILSGTGYQIGSPSSATVYIVDDDLPTVSIEAAQPNISEAGPPAGVYRFTRAGDTTVTLIVNCAVDLVNSTASPSDYQTPVGSVTFAVGQTTVTADLNPIDDSEAEFAETVVLAIIPNPSVYLVGAQSSATVYIADNEPPIVSIEATQNAAETGPTNGVYTFTRVGNIAASLTVGYARDLLSTASLSDYASLTGSVTFQSGATTATVELRPINDLEDEPTETVVLQILSGTGYQIGAQSSATVYIADNDLPTVSIEAAQPNISEAGPPAGVYRFTRVGDTTVTLIVICAVDTVNSTASPSDYQLPVRSVTFAVGQTIVTADLNPIDDSEDEPDETVVLAITPKPSAYLIGAQSSATVAITDNDVPTVSIAATQQNASETGPAKGVYTFTRVGDFTAPLTVDYAVGDGSTAFPITDYDPLAGSVTFQSGLATATVDLWPKDDLEDEPTERAILQITLKPSAYLIGAQSSATVYIADNDLPTVSIAATQNAAEQNRAKGTWTITRAGDTTLGLTVYVSADTANSTAAYPADYDSVSTFVTILAGQASGAIDITPKDDSIDEPTETVVLKILPNDSYRVTGTGSATVNILDNDYPTVSIAATQNASEAGPTKGIYTFTRVGDLAAPLTVDYAVDTVNSTASPITDYDPPAGSVSFQSGLATATVDLWPKSDQEVEPTETVILTITSKPSEYLVGAQSSATVLIADNYLTVQAGLVIDLRLGSTSSVLTPIMLDTTVSIEVWAKVTGTTSAAEALQFCNFSARSAETLGGAVSGSLSTQGFIAPFDGSGRTSNGTSQNLNTTADNVVDLGGTMMTIGTIKFGAAAKTIANTGTGSAITNGWQWNVMTIGLYFDAAVFTGANKYGGTTAIDVWMPTPKAGTASGNWWEDNVAKGIGAVPLAGTSVTFTLEQTVVEAHAGGTYVVRYGANGAQVTQLSGTGQVTTGFGTVSEKKWDLDGSGEFLTTQTGDSINVTYNQLRDLGYQDNVPKAATFQVVTNDGKVATDIAMITLTPELATVSVAATTPDASETNLTKGVYTFTRVGDTSAAMTVGYTLTGTATPEDDYLPLAGSVTFQVGWSTATVDLTPVNDLEVEPAETVILTITPNSSAYLIGTASATVNIADNDLPTVSVAATDPSASEAGLDKGTYTFTRAGGLWASLTVNYTVGGTAFPITDYETLAGSVTFAIDQTTATVDLIPVDNNQVTEPDKTVILAITGNPAYTVTGSSATVTINEMPVVTSVKLNNRDGRGPSAVDPSGQGVRTITVGFNKAVTFAEGDVTVQTVRFSSGSEEIVATPAAVVAGSGTATMTISLPFGAAVDTWVKVLLSSNASRAIVDLAGHRLDGDARSGNSYYIVDSATDLPTGDGAVGGDAVFYVGSLRGDLDLNHAVADADKAAFMTRWQAKDLDADFRGVGAGVRPPDGKVTLGDMDGFTSVFLAARASGRHLDPLPAAGGGLAAEVTPLPTLTTSVAGIDILTQAAGLLPLSQQTASPATGPQDTHLVQGDEEPLDLLRLRPVAVIQSTDAVVLRV